MFNDIKDRTGSSVLNTVLAVGLALLITACGGGGDSSSDSGGEDTPTNNEIVPTDMSGPPESIYS